MPSPTNFNTIARGLESREELQELQNRGSLQSARERSKGTLQAQKERGKQERKTQKDQLQLDKELFDYEAKKLKEKAKAKAKTSSGGLVGGLSPKDKLDAYSEYSERYDTLHASDDNLGSPEYEKTKIAYFNALLNRLGARPIGSNSKGGDSEKDELDNLIDQKAPGKKGNLNQKSTKERTGKDDFNAPQRSIMDDPAWSVEDKGLNQTNEKLNKTYIEDAFADADKANTPAEAREVLTKAIGAARKMTGIDDKTIKTLENTYRSLIDVGETPNDDRQPHLSDAQYKEQVSRQQKQDKIEDIRRRADYLRSMPGNIADAAGSSVNAVKQSIKSVGESASESFKNASGPDPIASNMPADIPNLTGNMLKSAINGNKQAMTFLGDAIDELAGQVGKKREVLKKIGQIANQGKINLENAPPDLLEQILKKAIEGSAEQDDTTLSLTQMDSY